MSSPRWPVSLSGAQTQALAAWAASSQDPKLRMFIDPAFRDEMVLQLQLVLARQAPEVFERVLQTIEAGSAAILVENGTVRVRNVATDELVLPATALVEPDSPMQ